MAEPENHTLHLLREMREEIRGVDRKVETLAQQVYTNHAELKDIIESLRRYTVGESVLGRYAAANVDSRLEALETRVSALEQPP